MSTRHFLEIDDLGADELVRVLELARLEHADRVLDGQGVALLFEKPSARTRSSMEMAVVQLGGHPLSIRGDEVGLDVRETVEDIARVLERYHAVIGARVFDHGHLDRMAAVAEVPIVNLLSDRAHPCQALADVLTISEELGGVGGRLVTYVGDHNNVSRSLVRAVGALGGAVRLACPPGHGPDGVELDDYARLGLDVTVSHWPEEAVAGSDVVYTDVWTSMGQEEEAEQRRRDFEGFTVDEALMASAPTAIVLHCLPAHRGEEISAEVVDGPRSRVFRQAENRMHAARGLLWFLVAESADR